MDYLSKVDLMTDVPLSRNYNDTFAFTNQAEQKAYFDTRVMHSFNDMYYVKEGAVTLPVAMGQYSRCNYLRWQNPDYPQKWFYGFITSATYVADETTRFEFIQDPIQTWFYEFKIMPCMVQREHVLEDTLYGNLIDEGIAYGDYVINEVVHHPITKNQWWIVVGATVDLVGFTPAVGAQYANIYSGLKFYVFDNTDSGVTLLNNVLQAAATSGKMESIVTIYMCPKEILQETTSGSPMPGETKQTNYPAPAGTEVNGYTPRNNKLLAYPYTALRVTNASGQSEIFRYEFFGSNIGFVTDGSPYPDGRILLWPMSYKNRENNLDYAINLGDYPQCSWVKDCYSNWLATQQVRWNYETARMEKRQEANTALSVISAIAGTGSGALSDSVHDTISEAGVPLGTLSGFVSGGMNIAKTLVQNHLEQGEVRSKMAEEKEVYSIQPPGFGGTVGNSNALLAFGAYGFDMERVTVTAEYAKTIDSYFDLYGYKVMEVKDPNIYGRPHWNYVQTLGSKVRGAAPVYATTLMESLLDRGLRFWHDADLGNFLQINK